MRGMLALIARAELALRGGFIPPMPISISMLNPDSTLEFGAKCDADHTVNTLTIILLP